jgi:hypothetical protein
MYDTKEMNQLPSTAKLRSKIAAFRRFARGDLSPQEPSDETVPMAREYVSTAGGYTLGPLMMKWIAASA